MANEVFFDNEGKQFLLTATSLTEHNVPVSGTVRRCIMCSCKRLLYYEEQVMLTFGKNRILGEMS